MNRHERRAVEKLARRPASPPAPQQPEMPVALQKALLELKASAGEYKLALQRVEVLMQAKAILAEYEAADNIVPGEVISLQGEVAGRLNEARVTAAHSVLAYLDRIDATVDAEDAQIVAPPGLEIV
jgi:hypothetical protein